MCGSRKKKNWGDLLLSGARGRTPPGWRMHMGSVLMLDDKLKLLLRHAPPGPR